MTGSGGVGRGLGSAGTDDGDDTPPFDSPQARGVSASDLLDALAHARPGDVLVVRNGTDAIPASALREIAVPRDDTLPVPGSVHVPGGETGVDVQTVVGFEVAASGTADQPVTIAAEEPGGFRLQGVSMLTSGSHVRVWGLSLEEGTSVTTGGSVHLMRHSWINPPGGLNGCAAMITGPDSVVGYCEVRNYARWGVRCRAPDAKNVRVYRTLFDHAIGNPGENMHEALQLGLSNANSANNLGMLAEYNLFTDCGIDLEALSIKSGGAIVRFNTLVSSRSISNRTGVGTTIVGNWLVDSDIIMLAGPGKAFFNHGEGKSHICPTWGTISPQAGAQGTKGYVACHDWLLAGNQGLAIAERNPGGRPNKPQYQVVAPPGTKPPVARLQPADVGPKAK